MPYCIFLRFHEAEIAGGTAKRRTLRVPAQGNRSATFAPLKENKPWDDHIPGTMRCTAFREAAPERKPSRGRV